MTKIYSLNSDVKFPDMEHYDMGKASDMALYLAHCDFYPFRSVIENNKIALDAIDESYRNLAEEARLKNDFFTEQWAMTSGTLHSCRVDLLTQYSLLLTMVSLLEEAVNTLCRLYHNINHLDKEVKDIKGSGLERAAKYLKDVVGIYEKSTLGNESKRKWYAVILSQWMEGSGLSYIMQRAIDYHKQHPENFRVSAYQLPTIYNDNSKEHRNVVFADMLEAIENIVLFSISNYFLRFSNEYKKIHGVDEFDNNWYEYVEFGTTNPLTILLQRNGFSRESATFIKKHKNEYVVHDGSTDELRLRLSLLNCGNTSVMTEAASIRFNAPKLFLEEED